MEEERPPLTRRAFPSMEKYSVMLAARSNPPSATASLAGKVREFTALSRHNSMNPLDIAVFYFTGFLILALYSPIPTPYALRRPGARHNSLHFEGASPSIHKTSPFYFSHISLPSGTVPP
jgi:hypothetical protein